MTGPLASMPWRQGGAYGAMGFALAFAALPLYVVLPHHYARMEGVSLSTVGVVVMAVRLVDAVVEPWLGRASDAWFARGPRTVLLAVGCAAMVMWLGMGALFFPAVASPNQLAFWLAAGLLLTSVTHGVLVIAHQAWGVRLGGDAVLRSRIAAWREGAGLLGVIAASAVSVIWGAGAMLALFGVALWVGWQLWRRAPQPVVACTNSPKASLAALWLPLAQPAFRRLLWVFLCNGTASAIPAALMLFFVQDRLQASAQATALYLALYFLCGAASMPLWLWSVRRIGLLRSWWLGMVLAIACFAWAAWLGAGQVQAFAWICALTGVAMGADLALPGALLAQLIHQQGAQGRHEGMYLGWWSLATKLNLALAAGAALPLLQWLGYSPGTQDAQALQHLAWAYALVPCALKLLAAVLLYALLMRAAAPQTFTTREAP